MYIEEEFDVVDEIKLFEDDIDHHDTGDSIRTKTVQTIRICIFISNTIRVMFAMRARICLFYTETQNLRWKATGLSALSSKAFRNSESI